jgi:hypothetical protein
MTTTDRNAPCPCGSGKKYKRCCLAREQAEAAPLPSPVHRADEELIEGILRFARRELGFRTAMDLLKDVPPDVNIEQAQMFWFEWMFFHAPFPDRSIADAYRQSSGRVVQRAWLESRLASWMTVLEVTALRIGEGFTCVDVLTGRQREILDAQASRSTHQGDMLLAFVVEHEGGTHLGLTHPLALPPQEGADTVKAIRDELGLRDDAKAPEAELRHPKTMRTIASIWTMATNVVSRRGAGESRDGGGAAGLS